jgi:hypothetical protein
VHKSSGIKTYFWLDADFITEGGVVIPPSWRTNCSEVEFPLGVTVLGAGCFYNCNALTSITIPESVTSIGQDCFHMCTSLTLAIVLPAIPPSIGYGSFDDAHTSFNIKVNSPYVNAYKTATNWSAYAAKITSI